MHNDVDNLNGFSKLTIWVLLIVGFAMPWWVGLFVLIGGLI